MNVTDSQKASSGAVLMLGALGANLVLTLLSFTVGWLLSNSSEGPFRIIEELLWLGAVGVLVAGLFQLSQAVDEPTLLHAAIAALILNSLVDTVMTLLGRQLEEQLGLVGLLANDGSMAFALISRFLLLVALARLSMKTHAWVVPLLGTVALFTLMRTAFSVAAIHRVINIELYSSPAYRVGMPLVSLFNAVAFIVAALAVKSAVAGGPNTQRLVADAGLRPSAPTPMAPGADFLVGGILLAVGIGVTTVSMASASNGGRYVVATGAIAVGIGRIIRGFIRLGRAG
jgi:hypothetical protein